MTSLRGEMLPALTFLVAALMAFRANVKNSFLPGWDYHYHLMSASIAARQWRGDAYLISKYRWVNPLDANTLFYTLLFPLEVIGGPLFAARVGTTLFYFVGYPLACAVALRLVDRPLWGSLLAFGVVHVWSMTYGGFMHFAFAAPFFVLSFALMERFHERPTWKLAAACASTCTLTFLAHAHVYAWMMALLALLTVLRVARQLTPATLGFPRAAITDTLKTGLRALAVVVPSLVLLSVWYYRTHYGELRASGSLAPQPITWSDRFNHLERYLAFTRVDTELFFILVLPLVCVACFLMSGRRRDKPLTFEIAFVATAASYLYFPLDASGQAFAPRHIDMAMWLLPLVVYPARPPQIMRRAFIVTILGAFAYARSVFFAEQLRVLQREYTGLLTIVADCPPTSKEAPSLVAYMSMGMESRTFRTPSVHQAHETLAAMCSMETPVYDTREYPHNVIPLRYRGAPPAPITILVSDPRWYARPGLWNGFEYVLVHGWNPSSGARAEAEAVATPIRSAGEWVLWKRR